MYVPDSWGLGSCTLPWGLKCTLCLTTNFKDNCFNQCNCPDSTHLNPYVPCLDKHQLNSPEPFVRREPSIRSKKEKSKQIRKYMLTWNYIFKTCNRLIWVANKFNRDIQSQFVFNFRDFLWEPGIFYKGLVAVHIKQKETPKSDTNSYFHVCPVCKRALLLTLTSSSRQTLTYFSRQPPADVEPKIQQRPLLLVDIYIFYNVTFMMVAICWQLTLISSWTRMLI